MKRATLTDIARETGFSVNTVSRALNGKPDVHHETREIILRMATKLNYHPDRLARGLRKQSTRVIGVVVSDVANPFFSSLMKSISKSARARDYRVLLQDSDESPRGEREAIEVLLSERIDGILICPVQTETSAIEMLAGSQLPVVLIGRRFTGLDMDYVMPDDLQGGRLAAQHLIDCGHERIGLINAPHQISSARERYEGFVRAHEAAGIPVDRSVVRSGVMNHIDGQREAKALLKKTPVVTAIAAYSDFVAFGIARAVWEAGLRIPEDISLIGFDDTPLATCLPVPLSTVRVPIEKLGARGVEILCDKIEGTLDHPVHEQLPTELVVRQSTARLTRARGVGRA